jgi:hypothetical protein
MQNRGIRTLVSGLVLSLALAACGGSDGPSAPKGFGSVQGIVRANDGVTPIPDAVVTLASKPAGGPQTTTDATGAFTLENVPAGNQQLLAKRGVFEAKFTVAVKADETVTAPPAKLVSAGKLAFVAGSYDEIEAIVRDSLKNPITELTAEQLGTSSITSQYKMIFLNCGMDDYTVTESAAILNNLKTWVNNGGILYASDWALSVVAAMYPTDVSGELYGEVQTISTNLVDPALVSFIGKSTATIAYDLPSWKTPETLSSAATVLVRGTFEYGTDVYTDKPLAIVLAKGNGKVVFTSFHNEAGVTDDQLDVLRYFIYLQ